VTDISVPRGSKARRKHPHFTHAELRFIAERTQAEIDKGSADVNYRRIFFKVKAALLARGAWPQPRKQSKPQCSCAASPEPSGCFRCYTGPTIQL
jgi:hypothetical protein